MTSNVGSSVIEKGGGGLGFQLDVNEEDSSYNRIKTLVNEELKQYFRWAFFPVEGGLSQVCRQGSESLCCTFSSRASVSFSWVSDTCSEPIQFASNILVDMLAELLANVQARIPEQAG